MTRPVKHILAIETSCDETAAAVIHNNSQKPQVLSSVVSSQIDLHKLTGGVVPEVAARAHLEAIIPVIRQALFDARCELPNLNRQTPACRQGRESSQQLTKIDAIAVTCGPGLIGALLIGFNTAKTLSYALNVPLIPINHIEGHIYSAFSEGQSRPDSTLLSSPRSASEGRRPKRWGSTNILDSRLRGNDICVSGFPLIALTVSGGHTSLIIMKNHGQYETIGQTLDDAAGEAFDKVAKLLDLGYPGGPIISKLAADFRRNHLCQKSVDKICEGPLNILLPRPMINSGDFNFSFSGLKTAVLHKVRELVEKPSREVGPDSSGVGFSMSLDSKARLCCAFEDAVVDVLISKTLAAAKKYHIKNILVAGGVSANQFLRSQFMIHDSEFNIFFPPQKMTGDNAAMIGLAAVYHVRQNDISSWNKVTVDSNLHL